jgi:SAM-dependent methyltransferase
MGLKTPYLVHFFSCCDAAGIVDFKLKKMCELGNQHMKYDDPSLDVYVKAIDIDTEPATGKEFFTKIGFEHTSIDINGLDGAEPFDLSKPIMDSKKQNYFDIITSFGTIEHVENQYMLMRNIHNMLKVGGIFYALVPASGLIKKHGLWVYTRSYFKQLAAYHDYKWISEPEIRVNPKYISLCWQKVSPEEHMPHKMYKGTLAEKVKCSEKKN